MAMFERVTEHVVASAGAKTLHPVADINSAERYKTFCMVERKKSFWFWKNPSMIPTFVTLQDLLVKGGDISAKEKQFTLIKKFEDNPTLNIGGCVEVTAKLAKKIAAQANVNLEGKDKMDLVINLGDIIKYEVPFEDLREAVKGNPIDITHPLYVCAAKGSPKTSLCVVVEELSTKGDGSIKKEGDMKISAGAGAGLNCIKVNIKAEGSVESIISRSYTIPPGTVLAYSCIEIAVDPNGKITLHDTEDTLDHSIALLQLPENPFVRIKNELEPFNKFEHIHKFQEEVKSLLVNASESDFRVIHILLYYANAGKDTCMSVSTLKHLLGVDITFIWKNLLSVIGFAIQEDENTGSNVVVFPSKVNHDLLKACLALVDSILDCHRKSWKDLPKMSHQHAHVIMKVIENEFGNKGNSLNDTDIHSMLGNDPSTMTFLSDCDFKKSPGNMLTFTGKNSYELLDVYAIMYFLSSGEKHCSIL